MANDKLINKLLNAYIVYPDNSLTNNVDTLEKEIILFVILI